MTARGYTQLAGAKFSPINMARVTRPSLRWAWFHRQIDAAMVKVVRHARRLPGGVSRVVISVPSQHAKSTIAEELTPAYALGLDEALKIFSIAYNDNLAKRAIRHSLQHMDHEGYQEAFDTRVGKATAGGQTLRGVRGATHYDTLTIKNGKPEPGHGHYMSFGLEGGATGHPCDLLILGDLIKHFSEALSAAHQEKIQHMILGALEARRPRAQIAIATRWAKDDPPEWIAEYWRSGGHDVLMLNYPAKYETKLARPEDPRSEGEGLWLDRYSQEEYDSTERAMMRANPALYRAQHQGDPMELGSKGIPGDYFETFDPEDRRWTIKDLDEVFVSVDPNAKAEGGSFAVCAVWGVLCARDRHTPIGYFRLDEGRGQPGPTELNSMVRTMCKKWRGILPKQWRRAQAYVRERDDDMGNPLIEAKAGGYAVQSALSDEFECRMLRKAVDKPTALALASSVMIPAGDERQCKVFVPSRAALGVTCHWVDDYLAEMAATGRPDDRRDETAQFIIVRDPSLGEHLLRKR